MVGDAGEVACVSEADGRVSLGAPFHLAVCDCGCTLLAHAKIWEPVPSWCRICWPKDCESHSNSRDRLYGPLTSFTLSGRCQNAVSCGCRGFKAPPLSVELKNVEGSSGPIHGMGRVARTQCGYGTLEPGEKRTKP